MIGITKDGIRKAYQTQDASGTHKHLVTLCKAYQVMQLSTGTRLDEISIPAVESIVKNVALDSIIL